LRRSFFTSCSRGEGKTEPPNKDFEVMKPGEIGASPPISRARRPEVREDPVRIKILQIKLVHTVIFWIFSFCVVYTLYSGVANRISTWTWVAIGLLLLEGVVLVVSGWTCPLTILVERQGVERGSVADIFLPKWFADRIFPICGTAFGIGVALILWRLFG
jgi:hypothetical protein